MLQQAVLPQVFHIHPRIVASRILMIVGVLVAVPILIAAAGERIDTVILAFWAGLIALCVVMAVGFSSQVRLIVSPEGVELRSLGFKVSSRWDNIERVEKRLLPNEGLVEGLVLRTPGIQVSDVVAVGSLASYRSRWALKGYSDFIPLSSMFSSAWRDEAVGAALRRYVPHIVE